MLYRPFDLRPVRLLLDSRGAQLRRRASSPESGEATQVGVPFIRHRPIRPALTL